MIDGLRLIVPLFSDTKLEIQIMILNEVSFFFVQ